MGVGMLGVEHSRAPEPLVVHEIVLGIAYPRRREHLGHVLGTLRLHLCCLHGTRLDDAAVIARDMLYGYLVVEPEALAQMGIRVGGPKDVLLGGMVQQQFLEHLGMRAQKVVLTDVNVVCHDVVVLYSCYHSLACVQK